MSDPGLERFQCAPGLKLQAHERVTAVQNENIIQRLNRFEEMMERLERRLWLAVYGIIAMILGQALQSMLTTVPQ